MPIKYKESKNSQAVNLSLTPSCIKNLEQLFYRIKVIQSFFL